MKTAGPPEPRDEHSTLHYRGSDTPPSLLPSIHCRPRHATLATPCCSAIVADPVHACVQVLQGDLITRQTDGRTDSQTAGRRTDRQPDRQTHTTHSHTHTHTHTHRGASQGPAMRAGNDGLVSGWPRLPSGWPGPRKHRTATRQRPVLPPYRHIYVGTYIHTPDMRPPTRRQHAAAAAAGQRARSARLPCEAPGSPRRVRSTCRVPTHVHTWPRRRNRGRECCRTSTKLKQQGRDTQRKREATCGQGSCTYTTYYIRCAARADDAPSFSRKRRRRRRRPLAQGGALTTQSCGLRACLPGQVERPGPIYLPHIRTCPSVCIVRWLRSSTVSSAGTEACGQQREGRRRAGKGGRQTGGDVSPAPVSCAGWAPQ